MADGAEFPKAIYRDGGTELVWGKPIETSSVRDADEESEALASGWRLSPEQSDDEAPKRRGRPPKE